MDPEGFGMSTLQAVQEEKVTKKRGITGGRQRGIQPHDWKPIDWADMGR